MRDKALLRGIENKECFGGKNSGIGGPMNLDREKHGLPPTDKTAVKRKREAMLRLSRRKKQRGWIGLNNSR